MDRFEFRQLITGSCFLFLPLCFVVLLLLLPFIYLVVDAWPEIFSGQGAFFREPYHQKVMSFTLFQAITSAVLTAFFALPCGYLLYRYLVPGKKLLASFSLIPFSLPSLSIALAFILVYGQNGFINRLISPFGGPITFLYNGWAIIIAHVYCNLFVFSLALQSQGEKIPEGLIRHARMLGLSPLQQFWLLEWPYLRKAFFNMLILAFLFSLTSFAIPLTLGGGAIWTTTEVAIYQSLRIDFSMAEGLRLALWQVFITSLALLALESKTKTSSPWEECRVGSEKKGESLHLEKLPLWGKLYLSAYGLFLALPLCALLADGLQSLWVILQPEGKLLEGLGQPLLTSLSLGLSAGFCVCVISLLASYGLYHLSALPFMIPAVVNKLFLLPLLLSPVIMAMTYFLFISRWQDPLAYSWPLVISIHSLMALPLAIKWLFPYVEQMKKLCSLTQSQWGLRNLKGFYCVELAALQKPLSICFLMSFSLSLSNFSAVAFFQNDKMPTLSQSLYEFMASYHFEEASVIACLMAALTALAALGIQKLQSQASLWTGSC